MTTHQWITHRLPTEADADAGGDVKVPRRSGTEPASGALYQHYSLVVPGQPWWPPRAANRVEVVPAPALSFAVGQQWRRRDGRVVTIKRINRDHQWGRTHPFWADGRSYTEKGACSASGELGHPRDLIELVSSPEPAPTHNFAVGQRWRRGDGVVVAVTQIDALDTYPIVAGGFVYRLDGTTPSINPGRTLVELVSGPAPAPQPCLKSLTDDQLQVHCIAWHTEVMRRAVQRQLIEEKRPGGLLA
jgi:hypothetical protein